MTHKNQWFIPFFLFCFFLLAPGESNSQGDCAEASEMVRRGMLLSDGSEEEGAFYRRAISLCPNMAEAHHNLAVLLFGQKQFEQAKESFTKAIESKDLPEFRIGLARLLLENKELEQAQAQYQAVLDQSAHHPRATLGLAAIYDRSGRSEQAKTLLEESLKANPRDPALLYSLGLLHLRLDDAQRARELFEEVLVIDPEYYQAALQLAVIIGDNGDSERASEMLTAVLRAQPDNVAALRALAVQQQRLGLLDNAKISLERALTLEPGESRTAANLGLILLELERPALAVEVLEPLASSEQPHLLLVLGKVYVELGRYEQAEENLQRALSFDATNLRVLKEIELLYSRLGMSEKAQEYARRLEQAEARQ